MAHHAAALRSRGFNASAAAHARGFHAPHASSKAHTAHHPGVGLVSVNFTAELHPNTVHLDEFAALLREHNATWACAEGPNGTTISRLSLGALAEGEDAALVLAYLAGRLAAPNATLAWGGALLDMPGLWAPSCDAPFARRATDPYFDVLQAGLAGGGGEGGGVGLALLLAPSSALRQFARVKLAVRVVGNETRALERYPEAPVAARQRSLAPSPDATQTGTGNQVTLKGTIAAFDWNYGGSLAWLPPAQWPSWTACPRPCSRA